MHTPFGKLGNAFRRYILNKKFQKSEKSRKNERLISDPKIFSSSDHRKNQPASKQKRKLISASNISPEGFDLSGLDKKYPAPTITSINNPRHHKSGQITTEHQDRVSEDRENEQGVRQGDRLVYHVCVCV